MGNIDRKRNRGLRARLALLAGVLCLCVLIGCSRGGSGYTVTTLSGWATAAPATVDGSIPVDGIFEAPGAGNTTYIQDSAYLGPVFGTAQPTLADLNAAVDGNTNISARFKALLREYCGQYVKNAPDADRRILLHNLKTIVVKETNDYGLIMDTFSTDAVACYTIDTNTITVLTEYTFAPGTWEYQILFHELSHAARNAAVQTGGRKYVIRSFGTSFREVMCDETLNTVFAVSLFDYEEPDLAYQLQSNYVALLLDSMDNYQPSDYINHSQSYFIRQLDEYSGHENYAADMIRLLQAQYDDFHDESYTRPQSDYYPLYDFVSDVYYQSRLAAHMPMDEAQAVYDELIRRITFDVPPEYELDLDHFRDHFLARCTDLGITG